VKNKCNVPVTVSEDVLDACEFPSDYVVGMNGKEVC
jgi:hypothetical protein